MTRSLKVKVLAKVSPSHKRSALTMWRFLNLFTAIGMLIVFVCHRRRSGMSIPPEANRDAAYST